MTGLSIFTFGMMIGLGQRELMALECLTRIAVGNIAAFTADEDAPLSGDSCITVEDNKSDFTNETETK